MTRFMAPSLAILMLSVMAVAQQSLDYDALLKQGKAQLQSGSSDAALKTAESAIEVNRERWEAYALAGGALMNLKRYEEAADKLSAAIAQAPEAKQPALRNLRRQCLLAESQNTLAPPTANPNPAQPASTTTQAEIVLWKSIENSTNPDDFQAYLAQYPSGAFSTLARSRFNSLREKAAKQQADSTELRHSVLYGAKSVISNGHSGVQLATGNIIKSKDTGKEDEYATVYLDRFEDNDAIVFPTNLNTTFHEKEGKLILTDTSLAFRADDGSIEFVTARADAVIGHLMGKTNEGFRITDNQGKRHYFTGQLLDSPYVAFLKTALQSFPLACKQLQLSVSLNR